MTRATALRKELRSYIDIMPERDLQMLKSLLTRLAEPPYIIEPANKKEIEMIEKRMAEYYSDPSSFVEFED